MFTGLVEDIGRIDQIQIIPEGKVFFIHTPLAPSLKIDDSLSVNGVCLTVTHIRSLRVAVQGVHNTLQKTGLQFLSVGDLVNLEQALRVGDRLGGHFVTGHVNAMIPIQSISSLGQWQQITFPIPQHLKKYLVVEGSVTLHGVSLTIAELSEKTFTVSIIPHTYQNTVLHRLKEGDWINLEVDILAKYVESLLSPSLASSHSSEKKSLSSESLNRFLSSP
jgi:riboflavin synthase